MKDPNVELEPQVTGVDHTTGKQCTLNRRQPRFPLRMAICNGRGSEHDPEAGASARIAPTRRLNRWVVRGGALVALLTLGTACRWIGLEISDGRLLGTRVDGVRAFLGIPYAAPPVGPLRWKPPAPPTPWRGVRNATRPRSECPQLIPLLGYLGAEDCLYLNVWAPDEGAENLPVMVWFHGGAFKQGSAADPISNGARLARTQRVVVVGVNYRLGTLGFMAHPTLTSESGASGNWGVLDQQAALRWVRDNIRSFGGDPNSVTIFGESSGGDNVCTHMISPASRGLFHRGISQSGMCPSTWHDRDPTLAEAEDYGLEVAAQLGCAEPPEALACLREASPRALVEAGNRTAPIQPGGVFYIEPPDYRAMAPNVDGVTIPDDRAVLYESGDIADVPLIFGSNKDEGTLFHTPFFFAEPVDTPEAYRAALERRFGATRAKMVEALYPSESFPSPDSALAEVTGDWLFVCRARWMSRVLSARGLPVFLYSFEKPLRSPALPDGGVIHAAEIPFVFGTSLALFGLGPIEAEHQELSDNMMGYWSRFAATGDPNGDGAVNWPRYDEMTDQHLVLDDPVRAGTGHKRARCDLWDSFL
ncbi:MAG: carboxylesterase family protein [Myxococcales bacterium]|nr:carboxylesterase family protein [Myxococcales bacterium]